MTLADRTGPGTSTARGPGRPRNGNIDEQILTATQELIDENEPITVNRIVQRSGVSRAALYLRWPSVTAEERFRQRIRLAMENPELQKTYWASHVSRRRAPVEVALRDAIACGVLRDDLDVEACFDLLAGVLYYQLVVRGDRLADEAVHARCRRALDVAWRGMLAG